MKENSPMTPSKSSDTKPLGLTKKISKHKGQNSIQSVSSPSQARKRLKRLGTDPLFKSRQMLDGKKAAEPNTDWASMVQKNGSSNALKHLEKPMNLNTPSALKFSTEALMTSADSHRTLSNLKMKPMHTKKLPLSIEII